MPAFTLRSRVAAVVLFAMAPPAIAVAQPAPNAPPPPPPPAPPSAPPPAAPPPAAPPPAAPTPEEAAKKEARGHFEKGLALADRGAWDAALAEFRRSLQLYPTRQATKNAAVSLRELHRFDEALEMFEALLKLPGLPRDDVDLANKEIRELSGLVGSIAVRGAEPGATIVIDGRTRGVTPLAGPLRVAVGTHHVRAFKEGRAPFEVRTEVAAGQAVAVEVQLTALTQSGRLQVTEAKGKVLEVVVDNVVVGKTPWEGSLPPGDHTVLLRGPGDLGTQPANVPVRLNQTTPLALVAEPLAAALRVEPTPAGASVAVDGVAVGRGTWEGRLRAGVHRVEIGAEGFVAQSRELSIAPGKSESVALILERDPTSPLWSDTRGRFFVEVDGGAALLPLWGGDLAAKCSGACSGSLGMGVVVAGRGGYRYPSGFMLSLDLGWLYAGRSVTGRATTTQPVGLSPNSGTADDSLTLRGFLVGASAGARIGARFPVTLRLGAGVLVGSVRDHRTGDFTSSAGEKYHVEAGEAPSALSFYLAPEARFGVRLGQRFELSAGVDARLLFGIKRPTWSPEEQKLLAKSDGQTTFAAEALTGGVMVAVVPGIAGRVEF